MYYWLMLAIAIVTEVLGTSSMKMASENLSWVGYSFMGIFISLSYYCLAQAVKKIPLAIAYTVWEGVGLLLISLISWLLFSESFSWMKIVAISVLIIGLVLINLGEMLSENNKGVNRE